MDLGDSAPSGNGGNLAAENGAEGLRDYCLKTTFGPSPGGDALKVPSIGSESDSQSTTLDSESSGCFLSYNEQGRLVLVNSESKFNPGDRKRHVSESNADDAESEAFSSLYWKFLVHYQHGSDTDVTQNRT